MFELGMRLAFDKPTIVIKDDKTPFSFDTSPVEHLTYPRDLRFSSVETFQEKLNEKIAKTASGNGQDSFLKSFGSFKVAQIDVEQASVDTVMLEQLQETKSQISEIRHLLRSSLMERNDVESYAARHYSSDSKPRNRTTNKSDLHEAVMDLVLQGKSPSEISDYLSMSRTHVLKEIKLLGLDGMVIEKE